MVSLSFYPALWVDVAIWTLWSVAVAWWGTQLSLSAVATDGWLTRLRPWEGQGRLYVRVGVRRWKRWLPDLGAVFGGRPKHLPLGRHPTEWSLLAGETRRAERVHWVILAALPVEALIGGGVVLIPMTVYGLAANLPCIAAQRYNRGRLATLGDRLAAATLSPLPAPPGRPVSG